MKDNSRFFSSLGLLIVLNAVVKPLWIFGIDRQVQVHVGAAEYGTYFSIFNLSIVLSFMLDWGLTNFFNRRLSVSRDNFERDAGSLIFLRLLAAIMYSGVIVLIAWFSGITRWSIVAYVILIQVFTSLFVFFRAIITSQQWFHTDAWLSVLDKLLMIILCGSFLYLPAFSPDFTIEVFLLIQLSCTLLANIVTLAILFRRRFFFSFRKLWPAKEVFLTAFPFAMILLLMSFHSRIDGFLLERLSGAEEAGKYAASYRLLDAANTVGYLFASFLLPFIAKSWSEKQDISNVTLSVRHILLLMAITASATTYFLAPWLQELLYHHSDPDYILVMQWCLPALFGYSLVQVYGTILTATGRVQAFCLIMLIAVMINLVLNLILIPTHGAVGSCIAALASQVFAGIVTMLFVTKKLSLPLDPRSWFIYMIISIALVAFLYFATGNMNNWMLLVCTAILSLGLGLLTKIIRIHTWKISIKAD